MVQALPGPDPPWDRFLALVMAFDGQEVGSLSRFH